MSLEQLTQKAKVVKATSEAARYKGLDQKVKNMNPDFPISNNTDQAWFKSVINSKQHSCKKTSLHSRSVSKKSGRKSRGNSQSKKSRKDKNLTIELNSVSKVPKNLTSVQNSSHNKASRYNQLVGS